jgi:hypothetical protein
MSAFPFAYFPTNLQLNNKLNYSLKKKNTRGVNLLGDFFVLAIPLAPANYLHFAAWQLDFSSHARYRSQATHEYA